MVLCSYYVNSIMNMNIVLEIVEYYHVLAMQLVWWEVIMPIFGLA